MKRQLCRCFYGNKKGKKYNKLVDFVVPLLSLCCPYGAYQSDACNRVYYACDRQPKLLSGLSTCDDKKSKVNSHTAAAGCVLFRTGDPTFYCHAAYVVTKVSGGVVYYDQVMTNCIVHFNIFSIVD
jgi:hypothetical protein